MVPGEEIEEDVRRDCGNAGVASTTSPTQLGRTTSVFDKSPASNSREAMAEIVSPSSSDR